MKHARILSLIFGISTIVLLCTMCAYVAYQYASLLWCGKHFLCSAPPWVAFLFAIPFMIFIGLCLVLHLYFKKKAQ